MAPAPAVCTPTEDTHTPNIHRNCNTEPNQGARTAQPLLTEERGTAAVESLPHPPTERCWEGKACYAARRTATGGPPRGSTRTPRGFSEATDARTLSPEADAQHPRAGQASPCPTGPPTGSQPIGPSGQQHCFQHTGFIAAQLPGARAGVLGKAAPDLRGSKPPEHQRDPLPRPC